MCCESSNEIYVLLQLGRLKKINLFRNKPLEFMETPM